MSAFPSRRAVLAATATLAVFPAAADAPPVLDLRRLYRDPAVPDAVFSPEAKRLSGRQVTAVGYLAPHAGRLAPFHILAAEPLTICPHCGPAAAATESLVAFLGPTPPPLPVGRLVTITGTLELGSRREPISGYVSLVRLRDARLLTG